MNIENKIEEGKFITVVDENDCVLNYNIDKDLMEIFSVKVPEEVGGRGIAASLVLSALTYARDKNLKVVPTCSYARTYIERHPEFLDIVSTDQE